LHDPSHLLTLQSLLSKLLGFKALRFNQCFSMWLWKSNLVASLSIH